MAVLNRESGELTAHQDVVAAVSLLLSGANFFQSPTEEEVPIVSLPLTFDPKTDLQTLYRGESVRIPNALQRAGVRTVGDLQPYLDDPDSFLSLRGIGDISVKDLLAKLGRA